MMKKKLIFGSLAAVLLIVLGTMAACNGHGQWGLNREGHQEFIMFQLTKELNLTESQKALIEKSMDEVHQQMAALHSDLQKQLPEVKNMILAPSITEDEINAFLDTEHQKLEPVKNLIVQKITVILNALTPDQKQKLVTLMEKHKKNSSHFKNLQ